MSEVKKFRKKPVTIEAMQWGGSPVEAIEIIKWMTEHNTVAEYSAPQPEIITDKGFKIPGCTARIYISTLEGTMVAVSGDFIIKGVQGEFYPCKPDIFEQTYEED